MADAVLALERKQAVQDVRLPRLFTAKLRGVTGRSYLMNSIVWLNLKSWAGQSG
jgi:hypothetical protein